EGYDGQHTVPAGGVGVGKDVWLTIFPDGGGRSGIVRRLGDGAQGCGVEQGQTFGAAQAAGGGIGRQRSGACGELVHVEVEAHPQSGGSALGKQAFLEKGRTHQGPAKGFVFAQGPLVHVAAAAAESASEQRQGEGRGAAYK